MSYSSPSDTTPSSARSRRGEACSARCAGITREPFNAALLTDIAGRRAAASYYMPGCTVSLREIIYWYMQCSSPGAAPGERELPVLWREDKSLTEMGRKTRRYSGFAAFQQSAQPGMEPFARMVEDGVPATFVGRSFFAVNRILRGAARAGIGGLDLDVDNAHPRATSKRHPLAPELAAYIRHRDARLAEVCEATGCHRDAAKQLFLLLTYGGGANSWCQEHGVAEAALPASVATFKEEQKRLRALDCAQEPELHAKCQQSGHERPDVKLASLLNNGAERFTVDLMEAAVVHAGGRVCSYEHDGLYVRVAPALEAELVRKVQMAADHPVKQKPGPNVEEAWAALRLAWPTPDWEIRDSDDWSAQLEAIQEARRLGSTAHLPLARVVAYEAEAYPGIKFSVRECFKHQGSGKYCYWTGREWDSDGERGRNALLLSILEILPRRLCEYQDGNKSEEGWSHVVAGKCRRDFNGTAQLSKSVEELLRHLLTDTAFELDGEPARRYLRFTNGVYDRDATQMGPNRPELRLSLCTNWAYEGSGLSGENERKLEEALLAWRAQETSASSGPSDLPVEDAETEQRLSEVAAHVPALSFLRSVTSSWESTIYLLKHVCRATFAMSNFQESAWTKGPGGNGKDTVANQIAMLLGDYFVNVPCEMITNTRACDTPSETFANLRGRRVVCIREMSNKDSVRGHVFKSVTDPKGQLKCRRLYSSKELRFSVSWLLLVATNVVVKIDESSNGISRRIALLEMPYKFCDNPQAANEKLVDPSIEKGFGAGNPAFFFLLTLIYRVFLKGALSNRVQPIPRDVAEATSAELREDWEDQLETFLSRLEPVTRAADASTATAVREAFLQVATAVEKKDAPMRLASRGFLNKHETFRLDRRVTSKRVFEYAFPDADKATTTKRFVRLRTVAEPPRPERSTGALFGNAMAA